MLPRETLQASRVRPVFQGQEGVVGLLRSLPVMAAVFMYSASQVGPHEAHVTLLAAGMLMTVWLVGCVFPKHRQLICLLGLGYGSLFVAAVALVVVLQMRALELPTGLVLLPLSVPLFSSYWVTMGVHRRPVALALNVLYLTLVVLILWRIYALGYRDLNPLVVLGMGALYVYSTHFIFFASTDSAVMKARLEERVQTRSNVLTGLQNHRAFTKDYLLGHWAPGQGLGLLLLDIDHFKAVNDTHGHDVGDRVLTQVARQLEGTLGDEGRVYRWGGEEFAVLVARPANSRLAQVAEAVRLAAGQPLDGLDPVTVSVGYGPVSPGDDREAHFSSVDAALRQARQNGRNRCQEVGVVSAPVLARERICQPR